MEKSFNPALAIIKMQLNQQDVPTVSPAGAWLGGTLLEANEGNLKASYKVRHEMLNAAGTLHGGIMALITDELIGASNFSLNNKYIYTSVNLVIDFLSPAKIGDTLIATAKVIRKGRKLNHFNCEVHSESGKLLAKASSSLISTGVEMPDFSAMFPKQ